MHGLNEVVRWRRQVTAKLPALSFGDRVMTFEELDRRSNRIARALIASGVRRGDRIAVLDQNHDRYFETIYGISKAGAIFVPINWRLSPREVAYILRDSGARAIFHGRSLAGTVREAAAGLPALSRIVCFEEGFEELVSRSGDADPGVDLAVDETAWIIYTSGTTGNPKGVELTSGNLTSSLGVSPALLGGMREGEATLSFLPFFHVAGAGLLNISVMAGTKLVLLREFEPREVIRKLELEKVTTALLVPAAITALVQAGPKADFPNLRTLAYGSAPIGEATLRAAIDYFGCDLMQLYGLSETAGMVTRLRFEDHCLAGARSKRLKSCGHPIFGHHVRVVGPDGRDVPRGEQGEVVIRGPKVMKGYWNLPDATAEALRGGWLHTGDVGCLDEEGFLYIQDRVKDVIISGGENISSVEVENCLSAHPAVAEVAVIGVPDEKWGESVRAVVVLKPGTVATASEMIDFCKERLAGFKRPRDVDFVNALPRNATGKVLKRELRRAHWDGRERAVN